MTSMAGDARHTADYVRNCREMGIVLEPPSAVKSKKNFSTKNGRIRFGMLSVKNVGEGIIEAIIEGRKSVEGTHDIYEFVEAIDAGELNRKAIESLVRAGAFDDINPNRAQLMAVCDDAVQRAQKKAKQGNRAQISLFQLEDFADEAIAGPELPKVADFSKETKLAMEKEMLGVYLSGHPLDEYAALIRDNTSVGTAELTGGGEEFTAEGDDADSMVINTSTYKDGDAVIMAGMINGVRTMITRKSQEMARMTLEDFDGVIDAIVFPKVYERKRNLVKNDMIVGISGRVSFKDESEAEILVEDIVPIENIAGLARSRSQNGRETELYGYPADERYAPEPPRRAENRPADRVFTSASRP
jgi:DNA polymerase-3 subunit alpha